jgi:hypothetical protein
MLKKRNSGNTLFKKQSYIWRATKTVTFKLYHLRTEANQNVHGTDIEQRKELKKTKPVLTKNLTLQQKD